MTDSSGVSTTFNRLSPFSDLFKSTWQVYRSHFVVYLGIMVVPFVFSLIVYFASTSETLVSSTGFWPIFVVVFLTLLVILLQLLAYAAVMHCTKENLGLVDSFNSALHKFLPFLAVILLIILISLIGFSLLVIPAQGFRKTLDISGAGYAARLEGKKIVLQVGYSDPREKAIPDDVEVETPTPTRIVVSGCDKQKVGEFAAEVRAVRPPEPYKGKGIRYENEKIRRKAGKAFVSGAK